MIYSNVITRWFSKINPGLHYCDPESLAIQATVVICNHLCHPQCLNHVGIHLISEQSYCQTQNKADFTLWLLIKSLLYEMLNHQQCHDNICQRLGCRCGFSCNWWYSYLYHCLNCSLYQTRIEENSHSFIIYFHDNVHSHKLVIELMVTSATLVEMFLDIQILHASCPFCTDFFFFQLRQSWHLNDFKFGADTSNRSRLFWRPHRKKGTNNVETMPTYLWLDGNNRIMDSYIVAGREWKEIDSYTVNGI